jgi:hypothetical protein
MLFARKKQQEPRRWNSARQTPAIRCSICTGEQEAGFIDRETGHFTGVMLLRDEADLDRFREEYGLGEISIRKIY